MNNSYIKTLYNDYSVKAKSIKKYLSKLESNVGELTQVVYEWINNLQTKYKMLDDFEQSRSKFPVNSSFMTEPKVQQSVSNTDNLKKINVKINQNAEQINYMFEKLGGEAQFLVQSLGELQSLVNNIYDTWNDLMTTKDS